MTKSKDGTISEKISEKTATAIEAAEAMKAFSSAAGQNLSEEPETAEEKIQAKQKALELLEKRYDELKSDKLFGKFFEKYGLEESAVEEPELENKEGSAISFRRWVSLVEEDFEKFFDFAASSDYFQIRTSRLAERPLTIYPKRVALAARSNLSQEEKEFCKLMRRRISCVFKFFNTEFDAKVMMSPSDFHFYANILPDCDIESWHIPHSIPVSVPLYVIKHCLHLGRVGAGYAEELKTVEKTPQEIERELSITGERNPCATASAKTLTVSGVWGSVLVQPLSMILQPFEQHTASRAFTRV